MKLTLRIRRTRTVRDLYRGKRFVVEDRFPGGRAIVRAKEKTRPRAFKAALKIAQPQTSPTAGGGSYSPPGEPPRLRPIEVLN